MFSSPSLRETALLATLLAGLGVCAPASCDEAAAGTAPQMPAEAQAPEAAPAPTDPGAGKHAGAVLPHARNHPRPSAAQNLNEHVRALTKALDLDAKQQADVRKILIQERVAILDLRKNGAPGAQDMVAASHAIVGRTRGQIRALLNDEQRKKFFVDMPEDGLAPAQADRDYWLRAARGSRRRRRVILRHRLPRPRCRRIPCP